MKILNYEIHRVEPENELKNVILNKAEQNAKSGLIQAQLELRHHTFLLKQLEDKIVTKTDDGKESEVEREVRLTKEAIERDERSINNWSTQLRAINYERNT